jgi:hypothetical protein
MSQEKLLRAVGEIDGDIIEEFVERDMALHGKRATILRRAKRLWWVPIPAVAAALALVVLLHHLLPVLLQNPFAPIPDDPIEQLMQTPWKPPRMEDDIPVIPVSAKPAPHYINDRTHRSSWYSTCYTDADFSGYVPSYTPYLPIYASPDRSSELAPHKERLESFIQHNLPAIEKLTGITDPSYTLYEEKENDSDPAATATMAIFGMNGERDVSAYASENSSAYMSVPSHALKDPSVFPRIPAGATKDDVLAAMADTVHYLESVFGVDFNHETVSFSGSSVQVNDDFFIILSVIDEIRPDLPREFATYSSCTILIYYSYSYDGAKLNYFRYAESEAEAPVFPEIIGKAPTLSIPEAHELLMQGYVYTGHGCSICKSQQRHVSFNEYDLVELSYHLYMAGEEGWYVPFYTFYKFSRVMEGGRKSWVTVTVPAVRLEGLEEYFEELTKNHDHRSAS